MIQSAEKFASDGRCKNFNLTLQHTVDLFHGFCKKWPTCMRDNSKERENSCQSVYIAAVLSRTFPFWTSFKSSQHAGDASRGRREVGQNAKTTKYLHFNLKLTL